MPRKNVELLSGKFVEIAYTDDELPPAHGADYDNEWTGGSSRKSLKFYDSTVDYMRNEWTEANARSVEVVHRDKPLLLFFDERTRTWNSAEALDVDHKRPWEQHFERLEVWSRADAMLAYNDASNLRTVPATYNRARAGADAILDEHGAESPQWKAWVDTRMRFDATRDYPAYDPEVHSANRTAQTTDAPWTSGVKRDGLAFDHSIKTTWLDHALKQAYAGEVTVPDPDHPDDRARDHSVQLFQCAATGQYVTRGGIDIDHEIPFAVALGYMLEKNATDRAQAALEGRDDVPLISKADVLDLYNNPENLRLMSRGANSSHEWEIGLDGQYYDPELDDAEYATPEPTPMVVADDAPLVYEDAVPVAARHDEAPVALDGGAQADAPARDGEDATNLRKRGRSDADAPDTTPGQDGGAPETPVKRSKDVEAAPAELSRRDAAILAMHPQDMALFDKVVGEVGKLDPSVVGAMTETQRENVALALVAAARLKPLADIDHVVASTDGRTVFGVQGALGADVGKVWFPVDAMKNQPFETTAEVLARHRLDAAQEPARTTETPQRATSHQLS